MKARLKTPALTIAPTQIPLAHRTCECVCGSASESEVPFLKPIMGKELSSLQFQPLEEQMFRAMAVLHDQKQRHCVARLVGMKAPATLVTPMIDSTPADKKMEKSFLTRKYKKLPFALPSAAAHQAIADR